MSEIALEWARSKMSKSLAQREVLLAMAEAADDDGTVQAPLRALTPRGGSVTPNQVQKIAEGLISAGWATKKWLPDSYQWQYRLNVVKL